MGKIDLKNPDSDTVKIDQIDANHQDNLNLT